MPDPIHPLWHGPRCGTVSVVARSPLWHGLPTVPPKRHPSQGGLSRRLSLLRLARLFAPSSQRGAKP